MFKVGDKVVYIGEYNDNIKLYDINIVRRVFVAGYIEINKDWSLYNPYVFISIQKYRKLKLSKINSNYKNDR